MVTDEASLRLEILVPCSIDTRPKKLKDTGNLNAAWRQARKDCEFYVLTLPFLCGDWKIAE